MKMPQSDRIEPRVEDLRLRRGNLVGGDLTGIQRMPAAGPACARNPMRG